MSMQLLCFDLDNTLIYSTKAHLEAFKKAFAKHKLPRKTNEQILTYFSLESSQLVKKLYPHLTRKEIHGVVNDHDIFLIKETTKYVRVIAGVKETLQQLKKEYKIAVLSNCKRKEILALLHAAHIPSRSFHAIIGNDMVTHPKPAPDEIFKAEQLLNMKSGYMIGDSVYDIQAGKKAGLQTIGVLTGPHTRKQLQKEKPSMILKSLKELPLFLKRNN